MRRKNFRLPVQLMAILLSLIFSCHAFAADKEKAKKHFVSGKALMKVDNFDGASEQFKKSIVQYPTKNALFNLAQCYRVLNRFGDAVQALDRLKKEFDGSLNREMKKAIDEIYEDIEKRGAKLEVQVNQADAKVMVDGREVGTSPVKKPLLLSPGKHRINVSLNGYETATSEVTLVSKKKTALTFDLKAQEENGPTEPETEPVEPVMLEPKVVEPSVDQKTGLRRLSAFSWTGIGATVVTGVVAGVLWGRTSSKAKEHNDLAEANSASDTPNLKRENELADDVKQFNAAAIALTATAGAFLAATTVFLIVDLKKTKRERPVSNEPTVRFFPGGIGVKF